MSNADVVVQYNLNAGTANFYWQNQEKISGFYAGVGFNTGYVKGTAYSSWSYSVVSSNQVVVTSTKANSPTLKQYFTFDQNDSFLVRLDAVGTNVSANWMGPIVVDTTGWVDIGITNDNRALVVPFDNDGFVSYNAEPINNTGTSYEVGAFYDNTSRNGLVVGSINHDKWKTGVFFEGAANKLKLMNVYGGATSSWDVLPHGYLTGNVISSPTMFVGFGADWRAMMQNYTAENTNLVPRLAWTNGVPFGWNSWGVIQENISYSDAVAVSDFFHTSLMNNNFNDNGTVYINLDSYWDNLSSSQLTAFTAHCHNYGQKAGIYFGPFAWFNTPAAAATVYVEGTTNRYLYKDLLLTNNAGGYQTLDGALALDPTHPGTQERISYYINEFTNWGFDYVKLDFLSHGTLEGPHYDTNATTGIAAYNEGMQYVSNAIHGRMFISESIAPLFPYQYGHSRRIACDAETSLIGNTEYTMNSVTYGWWLNNLYQFNDPDIMVFNGYGATTNENESRLVNGAVTGLFLDGDDLTTAAGQTAAQQFLTNAGVDSVARVGQTFAPVENNTGTAAANIFVRQNGAVWNVAVFNYTGNATDETVDFARAGLPSGNLTAVDLFAGTSSIVNGSMNVALNADQSKLFQLTAFSPATLRWSANGNSGAWDEGISANWVNLTNGQQSEFWTGDSVLFDDTAGAPTNVSVTGTVMPAAITVNSSVNNFNFSETGSITGAASLLKLGSSTLSILSPAAISGNVTIGGGAIYAGDFSFSSVASVTISNGATFDFAGSPLAGDKPFSVSGAGLNGAGALYNSSYPLYDQALAVTLTGDATFGAANGGNNRWDLGNGSTLSGPHKVTINFPNGYGEWDTVAIATDVGDMELAQGSWGLKGLGAGVGNPSKTITVDSGTTLDIWNSNFGPTDGYNKNVHVLSGGTFQILTGFDNINLNMTFEDNTGFNAYYGSGNQSLNGTYVLNGLVHFVLGDGNFIFTNIISGPGGFVWDEYNHEIIFEAANTYTGPTIIGGGLALALSGNGSIAGSSLIFLGGSNSLSAAIDASGRTDQTLALGNGQTLAGIGEVNGKLTIAAGATISPAGTNVTLGITAGASSTGTVSAANAIVLSGMTILKLNGAGTSDQISSGASINFGGILNLQNISATPLAAGNSFQLFSAPVYSGAFTNIAPTVPGPGLWWNTSLLASNGTISIIAVPAPPIVNNISLVNGQLIFGGTNGVGGGSYVVQRATNLSVAPVNWVPVATNSFDSSGTFYVTNAILPDSPQLFFRIQLH